MQNTAKIKCDDVSYITMPKGGGDQLKQTLDIPVSIEAPVSKGDRIGSLTFSMGGEEIASFDVVADETVEKKSFGTLMKIIWDSLIKM